MTTDLLEDLSLFLAYSLELEKESAERLREFADMMDTHHQHSLSALFSELAVLSDKHADEVERICKDHQLPSLHPWEFTWPEAEPPETCQYHRVNYGMTTRDALVQVLEQERSSAQFYGDIALRSSDPDIRRYARAFAEEELEHARAVELLLAEMPPARDARAPDIDPPHQPD